MKGAMLRMSWIIICCLVVACIWISIKATVLKATALAYMHYFTMTAGAPMPTDEQFKKSQEFVIKDMVGGNKKSLF